MLVRWLTPDPIERIWNSISLGLSSTGSSRSSRAASRSRPFAVFGLANITSVAEPFRSGVTGDPPATGAQRAVATNHREQRCHCMNRATIRLCRMPPVLRISRISRTALSITEGLFKLVEPTRIYPAFAFRYSPIMGLELTTQMMRKFSNNVSCL
jgi:hypothetical protein